MKLNEFRRRWVDGDSPVAENSINDSRTEGGDDWNWPVKNSTVRQPVRLRPKYVPEAGDEESGWFRQAVVRVLAVALVFVVALIVLGVTFDYLPTYLTTYVFDR